MLLKFGLSRSVLTIRLDKTSTIFFSHRNCTVNRYMKPDQGVQEIQRLGTVRHLRFPGIRAEQSGLCGLVKMESTLLLVDRRKL